MSFRIWKFLLRDPGEDVREVQVPDLKGLTVDEAAALLDTRGLLIKLVGKEGIIVEQPESRCEYLSKQVF